MAKAGLPRSKRERLRLLGQAAVKGWAKHKVRPKPGTYFGAGQSGLYRAWHYSGLECCCLLTAAYCKDFDRLPHQTTNPEELHQRLSETYRLSESDLYLAISGFDGRLVTPGMMRTAAYRLGASVRRAVFQPGDDAWEGMVPKAFSTIGRVKM